MYTVVLVDDEPVNFKSIRTVVEKKCREFQVTGVGLNGKEGLELAKRLRPDILITDIKMPVMDGIELARYIKKELPDTLILILSGYQDFEYAKGAIESGVCDYILKPIVPSKFVSTMEAMMEKLEDIYWKRRNRLLQKICRGNIVDTGEIRKYFGKEKYYGILVRKNGLLRRIAMNQEIEVFSIKQEQMIMYGRDIQEGMYLCSQAMISALSLQKVIEELVRKNQDGASYITVVASENSYRIEDFAEKSSCFYSTLAKYCTVGKTQVIILEQTEEHSVQLHEEQRKPLQNVRMLLEKEKYEVVDECIRALIRTWGEKEYPQLWMENAVRQLFYLLQAERYIDSCTENTEIAIEEAFYYATSIEELETNILAQIENKKRGGISGELKMDTPEYFQKIRDYIWENMAKPLTLQQICRHFGISQPYISKFFRKYEGTSFGNYLTQIRIRKAKELFEQNKDILIKDVAFMVGYNDQFYFSRIFRSVVGVSPSEYIRQNR